MTWSIIGLPATWCSTFGRADFMRVPLPAARMTTWRSDMRLDVIVSGPAQDGLSAPAGALRRSVLACGRALRARARTLSNCAQGIEVGVVARERAIVRIELDGAQQKGNRLVDLVAQREDGREHVERVIVLGRSRRWPCAGARAPRRSCPALTASVAANTRSSGVDGDAARGAMWRSQTLR